MSFNRRTFVKTGSAILGARLLSVPHADAWSNVQRVEPDEKKLLMAAIDAARSAGATYADARLGHNRSQSLQTREQKVQGLSDSETLGIGIRVLANGAWGFAATSALGVDSVVAVARRAVAQAKANRAALPAPIVLAPYGAPQIGEWKSPIKVDPFSIPIGDKVAMLLAANAAALKVKGTRFVNSSLSFLREEKTFANTEGSYTVQTLYRSVPSMSVTAVSADNSDFQSRDANDMAPRGLGYEYITECDMTGNAPRWAEEAVQKLSAKSVDIGRYDLVLYPSHLFLTIHESIAHPTELDRALGFEANYAGTSFVAPPEKVLGKLKYGPETLNIRADRSEIGSLSACGWDDEGVVPETYYIIKNGIFVDYQTTREQAPYLEWWYKQQGLPVRSHGNSYAQSWADVQFQRMPNISLVPGDKDLTAEDLIAATDKGIAIKGRGSYSIDQQRYNAQFGGQLFYEIRGGKIVGMLKDVAYQIRTPEFWNSMDMLGGQRSYQLYGTAGDGKGQPSQANAVSHGCVPTRFRLVNVINTKRSV
jgi:TldD protein